MSSLFARTTRRITLAHIRHVPVIPPSRASGLVARVYRQVEEDFGLLAPPVALHAPAPDHQAAAWTILRETLIVEGEVGRAAKEVVAAAVSLANSCPYCVDVHGATLSGLTEGPDAAHVMADRLEMVSDSALRELARWARASSPAGVRHPVPAPFPRSHAAELVGVAVTFHYYNRMVNVFLRDSPLPPVRGRARAVARGVAARMMGRLARVPAPPGASTGLLPSAPLPADLRWAAGHPHIAAAMSRAAAVFDEGGKRTVPARVRRLVGDLLPSGGPPLSGGGSWFDDAVSTLPTAERAAGRLALSVALASYRVSDATVDAARGPLNDGSLIALASWSSFTAARRAGALLAEPFASRRQ